MFGVAPAQLIDMGVAWFLGSDAVERLPETMIHRGWEVIDLFHEYYPTLTNFVDARHKRAIEWLEWLGFFIAGTCPNYGVAGVPFHWMMKAESQCVLL